MVVWSVLKAGVVASGVVVVPGILGVVVDVSGTGVDDGDDDEAPTELFV